jgi:signal transduction histidine kinase
MEEDGVLSFPDAPRADLDEALSTLVELANHVTATQGRLRALIRANQAVVEHLDLSTVLHTIVETATGLVGAQYGALAVLTTDGRLEQLIQVGLSEREVDAIGRLPEGRGLVGALTDEQRPIRLAHLTKDPRSVGFPTGHPPMDSFLGVPIRVHGEVYGNLYLTNQDSGAFSAEDEQLVVALAGTAGFAIDNARLFADSQKRQAWAAASAEITAALLSSEKEEFLDLLADRTLRLADADLVSIVRVTDDAGRLVVETARRRDGGPVAATVFPAAGSIAAGVLQGGQPRLIDEPDLAGTEPTPGRETGPTMAIPFATDGEAGGVLLVSRISGRARFNPADLELAADFAGRISLAMQLARARADQRRVLLLEDRGRIARDLHDHVIQQLFAAGLELHTVLGAMTPGTLADKVVHSIDTLDATITRIRTAIFALSTQSAATGVRRRIIDLVDELSSALPESPQIEFSGPLDLVVTGPLADDVVAVTREALTNVVKHAAADHVWLELRTADGWVNVTVSDDGAAGARVSHRSGLANLDQRAALRSGHFSFAPENGRTSLRWSVPVEGGVGSQAHPAAG